MKLKLLFWSAPVLAFVGGHVPEGNLYYFFAVQMLAAGIGTALHRREKRRRALAAAGASAPRRS